MYGKGRYIFTHGKEGGRDNGVTDKDTWREEDLPSKVGVLL